MGIFKLKVPARKEENLECLESWTVTWHSWIHSGLPAYPKKREQNLVFTNKEDADKFKASLEDAFKLTRTTASVSVEITKNQETV